MEVFASIQGEGLHVGEPQVFVRLRGCPLRCRYCDTPGSWKVGTKDRARIASKDPHSARHEESWATPFRVACWIAEVEDGRPRAVSLTGGEPLLWPGFVLGLAELVGDRRLHLETAGAHPSALETVLPRIHHVSLDLKLFADLDPPEPVATSSEHPETEPRTEAEWTDARKDCLTLVRRHMQREGRDACGKLVVVGGTDPSLFEPLLDDVAALAPELVVVVQPATPIGAAARPTPDEVAAVFESAWERGLDVRVLPQVHRVLGMP